MLGDKAREGFRNVGAARAVVALMSKLDKIPSVALSEHDALRCELRHSPNFNVRRRWRKRRIGDDRIRGSGRQVVHERLSHAPYNPARFYGIGVAMHSIPSVEHLLQSLKLQGLLNSTISKCGPYYLQSSRQGRLHTKAMHGKIHL